MTPIYSVADIRAIEHAAAAGLPPGTLMQRAGQAAAKTAQEMLTGHAVLVLAGPGNNGGDALEAATKLSLAGFDVSIVHLAGAGSTAPETAEAFDRARASDARFIDTLIPGQEWGLVIDGLFGIGLARPLTGAARELALAVNALGCQVLSLDVPSGLDADTGAVIGPDGVAVKASRTLTFIGDKPGLHTFEGRDAAGEVIVAPLGIYAGLLPEPMCTLNAPALFASCLKARPHNTHKGSFGDVAIAGGAAGMAGAPVLAARAALYCGAGRVFVAALDPGLAFDSAHPEIMFRDAGGFDGARCTLVLGPGMGDSPLAIRLLGKALDGASPLVVDADALNLVAASADLQARLAARAGPAILTPHPLEAARLLGVTAAVVQADRLAAARELAARFGKIVILKGSGSVIAEPGGMAVINTTGNPGLATGGTGDVLAGVCGALLAQGWPAREAALGAVWMHGAAADRLVEQGIGPIGMTAGELPAAVRMVLNALTTRNIAVS
ncbi:MAG: NAD(P)H-hydrate dehydratase [Pseudomonadota bacterium]